MIGLFDRRLPAIVNPAERCIRSNHPRLVRKYLLKLAKYLKEHNIERKITEIQHDYSYEAVEKLDELITAGMMCAEQACRNDVQLPWSEEIHEKMTQINILRMYMSSLRDNTECTSQFEKKQQSLKVKQPLPPTVKETTELLKVAQKQVRKMWKDYQSKRTTLVEDQEEAYIASRPNMCPERAARIFKNLKDSGGIYSKLPTKRHKGGSLSNIEVPIPREGETLQYCTITDPPLIEKEILRQNKRHFRQAENTPLASTAVSDAIGFGATTPIVDDIIERTADIDAVTDDQTSKKLLEIFKTSKPALEIEITKEKMMD